jgi:hypothetical protein
MGMNPKLIYLATTTHPYIEVEQWCLDNIGEWNETWYKLGQDIAMVAIGYHESHYYFSDEKSAILFKLKWS